MMALRADDTAGAAEGAAFNFLLRQREREP